MKKVIYVLTSLFILCFTACEDATEIFNPESDYAYKQNQFKTLTGQFDYIWKGLNNSYLFWYADSTDWDAVREAYLPRFQELDGWGKRGVIVEDNTIKSLMNEIANKLLDKHLTIYMSNPYKIDGTVLSATSIDTTRIRGEENEIRLIAGESFYKDNLTKHHQVSNLEYMKYNSSNIEHPVYSCVIDESIPLLHISNYYMTDPVFCEKHPEYLKVVDNFFENVRMLSSHHKLKGIIIDNRFNSGGCLADLDLFVQTFSSKPVDIFRERTKIGFGKYDYSRWIVYTITPNLERYIDIKDTPIVVLQDKYSASAGELVGHALSLLPNTFIIGENSWGAHGTLFSGNVSVDDTTTNIYDLFRSGSFNVDSLDYCLKKYGGVAAVKTATVCCEIKNRHTGKYELFEGQGIEPDKYVKFNVIDYILQMGDNQLDAALNYIRENNP